MKFFKAILIVVIILSNVFTKAQLKVVGRFLQDANHNNVMLRGVNVDVYKEGYINDINAVSTAIATTKTNVVRIAWWTHNPSSPEPQTNTTYNTPADLDNAITAYANKGILSIVMLHDLTGKADSTQFKNIITNYWTLPAVVTLINKHKDHLIINIANEWGPNYNTNQNNDSPSDIANFIQTYKTTIITLRNAGITVPLIIDVDHYADNEQIITSNSYGQGISNGQYLINNDPLQNLMFGVHTYYWTYQGTDPTSRINALVNSGLPFIIGEEGNLLPDGSVVINYPSLLSKANANNIGYLAWSWYNDGTGDNTPSHNVPFWMNMTIGTTNNGSPGGTGNGITIPTTAAQNAWGYNMLNDAAYGINATNTQKIAFTPTVLPLILISFTATPKGGFNLLEWKTANEINTKLFEIEFGTDGINFNKVGTVITNNAGNYSFKHTAGLINTSIFYRLKMIDVDGSFTYSSIIKIAAINGNLSELKLLPNPTKSIIKLTGIGNDFINTKIILTDANGKILQQIIINKNELQIDLSIYNKGFYFLKFTDGKVFKIVKQ